MFSLRTKSLTLICIYGDCNAILLFTSRKKISTSVLLSRYVSWYIKLIEGNGYETRQGSLPYVIVLSFFLALTLHKTQFDITRAWDKEKSVTYELSKTTLLSMSSVAQWIERPPGVRRSWVRFLSGTQIFLCPMLVSC